MSQIKHKEFSAEIKLIAIELLKSVINAPSSQDVSLTNFNFNVSLESKADAIKKLIFVIVSIEIKTADQKEILGVIVASCIYEVANFEEIIKIETEGKINIPQPLVEILNSISISTTRGIMFSTFKGTFLHNAFLPIIDPQAFKNSDLGLTKQ
jgi:hypothetical protein